MASFYKPLTHEGNKATLQGWATDRLAPENLWAHQNQERQYALEPSRVLLWEPRVGKTRATLATMAEWFAIGLRRVLIIAPQTVCGSVWDEEMTFSFQANFGKVGVRTTPLYSGSIRHSEDVLRHFCYLKKQGEEVPTVIIINRDRISKLVDLLVEWGPEALVIDELHDFKTPSSDRHLAALRIAKGTRFRRGLTGTPTPNNYGDLYGQYKIIEPRIFGTRYADFASKYLNLHPKFRSMILSYKNVEELRERAFSIASVVRRNQVFQENKPQDIPCKVTLPPKVRALYDKIANEHVAELEAGTMKFDHVLMRLTRLQQLAGGFLPYPDEEEFTDAAIGEWKHDAKLDAVLDEIDDITGNWTSPFKVVVFHRFREEGNQVFKKLPHKHAALLNGDTPSAARAKIISNFNNPMHPLKVLVVQEQVGSVGISLKGADFAIFMSSGYSYATHTQARDRIFKEDGHLTYIYVLAQKTVDMWVQEIIRTKQIASQKLITGNFKSIVVSDQEFLLGQALKDAMNMANL